MDVIIIGAGTAGLVSARELSKKGKKIIILEARDRIGGRIYTKYNSSFHAPLELGAEFIHGKQPLTTGLLKKAGLPYHALNGTMWLRKNGQLKKEEHFIEEWKMLRKKLKVLKVDMSINAFLFEYFEERKYANLRNSVRDFVSGYDTADPQYASTLALGEEWMKGDNVTQYRPDAGYGKLISYLHDEAKSNGCEVRLSSVVKMIKWGNDFVEVVTGNGTVYNADKAIITVPVGVLQAGEAEEGAIHFSPGIPEKMDAVKKIGMGAVIKILLQFNEAFWKSETIKTKTGVNLDDMDFIFSEESIPTWWTQHPKNSALLTGWLGGPNAAALKHTSEDIIIKLALKSLASIFQLTAASLQEAMSSYEVVNWTADPFSKGSYSYATTETRYARKIMAQPVENTLYFAGEAFHEGSEMGTVEAAIASGMQVAECILDSEVENHISSRI